MVEWAITANFDVQAGWSESIGLIEFDPPKIKRGRFEKNV
jgi:hypothetical protein